MKRSEEMKGKICGAGIACLLVFALCMVWGVQGLRAGEVKIGYVDAQRVFSNSKVGKEAVKHLSELEQSYKQKLDAKKAEIDRMEEELRKQYFTLSESARQEKNEEVERAKIEIKRMAEDADRELAKLEKEYLSKIDREVSALIQEFGREGGYTLILGNVTSAVLYADESIDITEDVIRLYDSKQ